MCVCACVCVCVRKREGGRERGQNKGEWMGEARVEGLRQAWHAGRLAKQRAILSKVHIDLNSARHA